MFIYLLLNIFTPIIPIALSFERRVTYFKKWRYAFSAIVISGAFFIAWDIWFTVLGIWSFNPEYLIGVDVFNLPVEEILFFITVPFACLFIYEVLSLLPSLKKHQKLAKIFTLFLTILLLGLGLFLVNGLYTRVVLLVAGGLLFLNLVFQNEELPRFYLTFLFHLLPFFIVNGVLTSWPVVEYNDLENLGIRMGTIPVEDLVYSGALLLMNINLYDWFGRRGAAATN